MIALRGPGGPGGPWAGALAADAGMPRRAVAARRRHWGIGKATALRLRLRLAIMIVTTGGPGPGPQSPGGSQG